MTQAFVTGGTGAVGQAVLQELAHHNIDTCFSYFQSKQKAQSLAKAHHQQAIQIDLKEVEAIRQAISAMHDNQFYPDIFIHCAVMAITQAFNDIELQQWEEIYALNCRSAFIVCQELLPSMSAKQTGDILFVGALDQSQSIRLPVHFSASQGMLQTMTMALSKEFGPQGVRVNMISIGLLEEGLSSHFESKLHDDYLRYSCLKRKGTTQEAAKVISWFARENQYISGKVIPVNGGI